MDIAEPYFEKIRNEKDPVRVRKKLIETLIVNHFNILKTASEFGTTTKTVRKWWRRFQKEGIKGLADHSRKPLNSPKWHQTFRLHYLSDLIRSI